ncbi:MAG: hypothetical protein QNJ63_09170 [Calothrix sp. MO_192.B10]|nr:hypothetical protein [Calothrix sp. MO_192.B10]
MNQGIKVDSEIFNSRLQEIATAVHNATQDCQGDAIALLALLRKLEYLHREIRDNAFQNSLPNNRQALYGLLKDIESEGGWPYIERMKLQRFLVNLIADSDEGNTENGLVSDRPSS